MSTKRITHDSVFVEAELTILLPVRVKVEMEVDTGCCNTEKDAKAFAKRTVNQLKDKQLRKVACKNIADLSLEAILGIGTLRCPKNQRLVWDDFFEEVNDMVEFIPKPEDIKKIHDITVNGSIKSISRDS